MNTAQRDGLLLAASATLSMVVMNSPWATGFSNLLVTPVQIGVGDYVLAKPLELWINDFLMAIFFLLVGVEIKHEWLHGALGTPQARMLPFGAALGGMLMPALIYTAINWGQPVSLAGWAIPAATDIAFALGLMALAAPHTRPALLVFLTAVAVLDDLGAIVVIALFYTDQLSKPMLAFAALGVAVLFALSSLRVRRIWPYVLVALLLWLCVLKSGVHATLAGVLAGLFLPSSPDEHGPGEKLAHALKPWVSWVILPLFGLVNAGVALHGFSWGVLMQSVTLGVALGLLLGKPIGILLGVWVSSSFAKRLPEGLQLRDYVPVACFCGIGFTMALFIGTLAFEPGTANADAAKMGVLIGTLSAFIVGAVAARVLQIRPTASAPDPARV
jgi:Na+:H+ antiporter, NhaA family